ncbi:FG-GAP repeat protein [Streptomyces sp. Midd1]|uniref:FG-GAP repeat protein n=1 Tax=Streptomyces sp. Midd3 TaxID=3161191 RepID=UPI0034DB6157
MPLADFNGDGYGDLAVSAPERGDRRAQPGRGGRRRLRLVRRDQVLADGGRQSEHTACAGCRRGVRPLRRVHRGGGLQQGRIHRPRGRLARRGHPAR